MKSPPHTARVKPILELYPDARFVHIVRDPQVTIPSTIRTWQRMIDSTSLQVRRERPLDDQILDTFERMCRPLRAGQKPDSARPVLSISSTRSWWQIPWLSWRRFTANSTSGDFEPARPAVQNYLDGVKNYQTNRYQPDPTLVAKIVQRCGDYMRRTAMRSRKGRCSLRRGNRDKGQRSKK